MKTVIYDIETYPNAFTCTFYFNRTDDYLVHEISGRKNDYKKLHKDLKRLSELDYYMVGFNNLFFDYPVLDYLFKGDFFNLNGKQIAKLASDKAEEIINTDYTRRWFHRVRDEFVKQLDLMAIHHFDNVAKSTSLKLLEFNMGMDSIQDLPFKPGSNLLWDDIDRLIEYNKHDVYATYKLYELTVPMIDFRMSMDEKFLNYNDPKIGSEIFINKLEKNNVVCYEFVDGRRRPVQTPRNSISIKDIIFDDVKFERPEFNSVLKWLQSKVITETKGVFTGLDKESLGELVNYCDTSGPKGKVKNLNCIVDGFRFDFGTGGIHGSVESATFSSDDDYMILDIDVTSLYPSIAISYGVYPEHLGEKFVDIYAQVKEERLKYKKGTPENAALKLALNGVYGKSNDRYSPFYDPKYTMTITVNGQLLLCMLAERLMALDHLTIIQINTDGITAKFKRSDYEVFQDIMFDWELQTGLRLEEAEYKKFFVRDVNNYIALYNNGNVKRKGVYEYDIQLHQNHSALIIPKAVESHLIHGTPLDSAVIMHDDDYDFFLRTKVGKTSKLLYGDEKIQNVSRYYIAKDGDELTKVMPPLKGKNELRRIGINKGNRVALCNDSTYIDCRNVDYQFYIEEAQKLVEPLCQRNL